MTNGCITVTQRGQVGGAVGWRLVEHRLDAPSFGDEVGRAPRVERRRGDAVEGESLVTAAFEAGGEDVEWVLGPDRVREADVPGVEVAGGEVGVTMREADAHRAVVGVDVEDHSPVAIAYAMVPTSVFVQPGSSTSSSARPGEIGLMAMRVDDYFRQTSPELLTQAQDAMR